MKRSIVLAVFLILGFMAGIGVYLWGSYFNQKNPGTSAELIFEVRQGESFTQLVNELEQAHLIRNAELFSLYAKLRGQAGKMKVGEYALRGDMYPSEVLSIINSGKSVGRTFVVPEGTNIYEMAKMWDDEGYGTEQSFLSAVKDPKLIESLLQEKHISLEGYLFPETYQITKFTDAKQLVAVMVKKFLAEWSDLEAQAAKSGMTRHQIVTLSSIIEKETGAPEERPLISSVFHNRLQKGMLLQTDPTVIYGKADQTGKLVISITKKDLGAATRYNTYVIKGLPPGPIASPGREALEAALEPAESEYLFFVSKNQGTHTFSKDYKTHLEAVKRFQMNPKAREGKSWRELKSKKNIPASPKTWIQNLTERMTAS